MAGDAPKADGKGQGRCGLGCSCRVSTEPQLQARPGHLRADKGVSLTTERRQLSPHLINVPWIPGQGNRARTLEPALGTAEGFPIRHSPACLLVANTEDIHGSKTLPPGVWDRELWLSDWRIHRAVAEGTVTLGHQLEF